LGVAAERFCAFDTVTSDEGLKIYNAFVSSMFGFLTLSFSVFDIAWPMGKDLQLFASSPAFYVGGMGSFGLAVEEVSPPKPGNTAGSI
jgi:hypothetical protein